MTTPTNQNDIPTPRTDELFGSILEVFSKLSSGEIYAMDLLAHLEFLRRGFRTLERENVRLKEELQKYTSPVNNPLTDVPLDRQIQILNAETTTLKAEVERLAHWKEHAAESDREFLQLEDWLIGNAEIDLKTGLINRAEKCKERIRDLIAKEGELGDLQSRLNQAEQVVMELREALCMIACWAEGEEVTGCFDEPGSAAIARKALTLSEPIAGKWASRKVLEKCYEALDSDAIWPLSGSNCPEQITAEYATGGSLTVGPTSCRKGHELIKEALTSARKELEQ